MSLSGRGEDRRATVTLGDVEEEDAASWAANPSLAAPLTSQPTTAGGAAVPRVKGNHTGSISLRPRPRTISSQTTTFLMKLSKLHLDWNVSATTALVYALRAVGGINVKADKTLLAIDLPDSVCSQPRVVMVEKEAPLKTILLDSIVSATYDKADTTKRSLRLVYWFDKNRKPQGPPTHPQSPSAANGPTAAAAAAGAGSSAPAVVNIANASSKAKQFLLSITFASHLDARDVYQCLNYMLSYGCPSGGDLFRLSADTPAEFILLHSGCLEKKGKSGITWSKRFARLYAGSRLVVYRTEKSDLPVNVLSLVRGCDEAPMVARAVGKDQLALDLPGADVGAEPAHLLKFASTREREQWLQALQIEFDQPLKELLRRPGPVPALVTALAQAAAAPALALPVAALAPAAAVPAAAIPAAATTPAMATVAALPAATVAAPVAAAPTAVAAAVPTTPPAAEPVVATPEIAAAVAASPALMVHTPASPTGRSHTISIPSSPANRTAMSQEGGVGTGGAANLSSPRAASVSGDSPVSANSSSRSSVGTADIALSAGTPTSGYRPPIPQRPAPQLPKKEGGATTPSSTPSPEVPASPTAADKASVQSVGTAPTSATLSPPPAAAAAAVAAPSAGQRTSPQPISNAAARAASPTPAFIRAVSSPLTGAAGSTGATGGTAAAAARPPLKAMTFADRAAEAKAASMREAELTYSYYNGLLALCASPELLRMPEHDQELIIPKDAHCGNVNLLQLSQHGKSALPQAANPNLRAAQQKAKEAAAAAAQSASLPNGSPPALSSALSGVKESSFTSSSAAATPTVTPSAFNPQTHTRVSVRELLNLVQEQRLYFSALTHFRAVHSALLFKTTLPSVSAFLASTPSTSIFALGKRGASLQELDRALGAYHTFMHCSGEQLKQAKLLCFENEAALASTSSSQIGFAFPGFDSQVFDIGRFSILSAAQMFLGLENSFEDAEWTAALKASSVGKELMQSSGDLSALFESPDPEDQNRARALMHAAQLEVLHNIALAAHMRQRWAVSRQQRVLREGDVIAFIDVLAQFEAPDSLFDEEPVSAGGATSSQQHHDAIEFQYSRNHMQLEQWSDVTYVYAPPKQVLQQFLKVRMEAYAQSDHPTGRLSVAAGGGGAAANNGPNEAASNPLKDPHHHHHHAQSSPGSSPRRHPTGGSLTDPDHAILVSGGNPLHAVQPLAITSYSRSRHFLFDCFHYLLFLRLLFDQRKTMLESIENALHVWTSKYQKDSSKSKGTPKYESISGLKSRVEEEKRKIMAALAQLPSNAVMEGIVKLQSRLAASATLTSFLPARPLPGELAKAMTLTPDQLDQRKAERSMRKSLLALHIQSRTAAAATAPAALTVAAIEAAPATTPTPAVALSK